MSIWDMIGQKRTYAYCTAPHVPHLMHDGPMARGNVHRTRPPPRTRTECRQRGKTSEKRSWHIAWGSQSHNDFFRHAHIVIRAICNVNVPCVLTQLITLHDTQRASAVGYPTPSRHDHIGHRSYHVAGPFGTSGLGQIKAVLRA